MLLDIVIRPVCDSCCVLVTSRWDLLLKGQKLSSVFDVITADRIAYMYIEPTRRIYG